MNFNNNPNTQFILTAKVFNLFSPNWFQLLDLML